ncbi:MAG TPA: radical SAM protein [Candidatus Binataceae bacterium]|nr:radical SAM protein [Candidatus Binataceae bacterium]
MDPGTGQQKRSSRTYRFENTSRALNPTGGFLKGFAFSLNPYVGCAFGDNGGCPFCYVRALPIAMKGGGSQWGSWVIAKINLKERLRVELAAMRKAGRLDAATVFMSSATDPYQGFERKLRISRGALEAFLEFPVRRVLLQTRSPMVERDIDLLKRMGDRVIVSITLETDDDEVRRAITPTSPSVQRRLKTARTMRSEGIPVQLAISPMLPNHPERFATLADDAADRVVVDTFFAGDGSGGRRSRGLGIGALYESLGYREWFRPGAEAELLDAMRARLGEPRVLYSRDGFTSV